MRQGLRRVVRRSRCEEVSEEKASTRRRGEWSRSLTRAGVQGATVLEIGGGVGEIGLELLKRDAARVVNLELSAAYEEKAKRLFRAHGLEERVNWCLHDIAADPDVIEPADIVVLHRVVCCYPDHGRLLGAAADHAGGP